MGRAKLVVLALVACEGGRSSDYLRDGPFGEAATLETADGFQASFLWAPIDLSAAVDHGHVPVRHPDPRPAGPVRLRESAAAAGLGRALSGGNSHGVGVGFVDVDGDGREDIVVINGFDGDTWWPSLLYRNRGDGTFEDITGPSGLGAILAGRDGYAVAAADYDGDGDLDLFVSAHPHDVLLQNQGDGTFIDVSVAAGAAGPRSQRDASGSSKIGAFGDLDGDGWLDIVAVSSTFLDQPANGYLLRNRGDGTFEDVTAATGLQIAPTGNPCAVMWTDYDNDGQQDIFVWNDRGDRQANRSLLRNDRGTLVDVTSAARLTHAVGNPMGIDSADLDRNGHLDYYVSNIGGNPLFLARGDGTFVDASAAAGTLGEYGWGLGFEDLDHDTWWDIFVAQEDDLPYLTFTHAGVDYPLAFARQDWSHPQKGQRGHNVAVAFADYDGDGRVDAVTAGTGGNRIDLWRNETDTGTNGWLHVSVPVTPGRGERGGVSARVVARIGDAVLWRDITGGSSRASQNAMTVRFGLGEWSGARWVAVLWPDGRQLAARNVAGGQVLELR